MLPHQISEGVVQRCFVLRMREFPPVAAEKLIRAEFENLRGAAVDKSYLSLRNRLIEKKPHLFIDS